MGSHSNIPAHIIGNELTFIYYDTAMLGSMYFLRSSNQIFGETTLYKECVNTENGCSFPKFRKIISTHYPAYFSESDDTDEFLKTLYNQFTHLYGNKEEKIENSETNSNLYKKYKLEHGNHNSSV